MPIRGPVPVLRRPAGNVDDPVRLGELQLTVDRGGVHRPEQGHGHRCPSRPDIEGGREPVIVDLLDAKYRIVEQLAAEPKCGEDFCDHCGDCLACYAEDGCPRGFHTWCVYANEIAEW